MDGNKGQKEEAQEQKSKGEGEEQMERSINKNRRMVTKMQSK